MDSATISIVVPCYNVSHIIKDCVTSLLMQTYSENTITIFLINDGSSDGTDKIINYPTTNIFDELGINVSKKLIIKHIINEFKYN